MNRQGPELFREWSSQHFEHAENIAEVSVDWAAVAYFYSSYHAVKHALAVDPVFDNIADLKKLNPNLMPDDRYPTTHKVRRNQPGFGVNELVQLLYPTHIKEYEKLHQSSIRVRYDCASPVYALADLRDWCKEIRQAATTGLLQASVL